MSLNLDLIYSEFNLNVASDSDRIVYLFEEFRLDASRRMLYRGGEEVALPPKAIETLLALIELRGEIVGKDDLMKTIWADTVVEESNLAHYLYVLRKTLGRRADGRPFIETFRRRGYRFDAAVRVFEVADPPKSGHQSTAFGQSKDPRFADWQSEMPDASPKYPNEFIAETNVNPLSKSQKQSAVLAAAAFLVFFVLASVLYFQLRSSPNLHGEISVTPLTNGHLVLNATIAPDGKYFVYHDIDGTNNRLWLQQTGQTTRIELIPAAERTIGGKTFSPNGEFIYFVSHEKGAPESALYRIPTLGGTPTRILTDIASQVSFSPDGVEMVFARHVEKTREFQLVSARTDGREERVLLTRPGANGALSSGGAWSPDGKLIAFGWFDQTTPSGEGTCTLAAVEVRSGAVRSLSPEKWDTCYRMMWTPEGEGLVFLGTRAGEVYTTRRDQVYYLSAADGRSRRLTTDGSRYQDQSLGVTSDGSVIAVPSKKLSQIWVMDARGDSRTAVQLTDGQTDGPSGIAPLPDGRVGYISRVGENLGVWVMNADGSGPRQLTDQFPFAEELRAAPDGRFFIFSARRDRFSHLYRIDPNGTNLQQLTDGESYEIDSAVSPDSRWVYYGSYFFDGRQWKAQLRKTSLESGETVVLRDNADFHLSAPNISPDGKLISGLVNDGLKILSAADGELIESVEAHPRADLYSGTKWTPDGRALTYLVYRNNGTNVWSQPVNDAAAARPLTDFPKGYIYFYAFSHDGTRLYIARGYQVRDAVLIARYR